MSAANQPHPTTTGTPAEGISLDNIARNLAVQYDMVLEGKWTESEAGKELLAIFISTLSSIFRVKDLTIEHINLIREERQHVPLDTKD